MRRTVMADKGPAPAGPYSHAVVANGFVFVSGQGPVNPETGNMPDAFADQVRQTLEIVRTMNVAGVDLSGWCFPETRHWPVVNGRIGGAARLQMEHFLECVTTGIRPLCDRAGRPRWRSAWRRRPLWQAMGPRCLFRRSNGQNTLSTRKGGRTYDGRASRGAGKDDLA